MSLSMRSVSPMPRAIWQALLGATVLGCLAFYIVLAHRSHANLQTIESIPETPLEPLYPVSEYYEWSTATAFRHIDPRIAANATLATLCQFFPKQKLLDIQPVLKTGHGAMQRVRSQLNSTAACLDNLLIFSDLDQEVRGRPVMDTVGDIPPHLIESDNQTLPYRHLKQIAAAGSLDQANLTALQGWETDKFKFLTDISRAWRISPERRWYVFFEGDTFMVWDTVFRLLENFDADVPQYFGSPSPGRAWFANGGPGFILSRGAMKKLIADDYDKETGEYLGCKLVERHWQETLVNCCGDSILGWALYDAGVPLKGLWPMFNPHPPHGVPFSDMYWCQPVLSMHKPGQEEMDTLWRWEWANRNSTRPLLYRDMAISYYNSFQTERRDDWDNAVWDAFDPPEEFRDAHASLESCHQACRKHAPCFQWTYHLRHCHFVRSFRYGRAREPLIENDSKDEDWTHEESRYMSGWDTGKIGKWIQQRPCDQVQWVRPSIERIF